MKTFIIAVLMLTAINLSAQTIKGTVTDQENMPLWGVQVFVEELHKGTYTDEHGNYEITGLPLTTVRLSVTYIGYEKQFQMIKVEAPQTEVNFVLKESVFKMDEVIISTALNKLQSENVMKVDRASVEMLKNNGAATLIDGMESMAGVSQLATGLGIGKPVIRGLRGNRVLVYNQGVRLENQQFGDEHGLGVHEGTVDGLEVIKGPASLLYGSDALGGVIYFNPLKFTSVNNFKASVEQAYHSNTQGSTTNAVLKHSNEQWKFLVQAARNTHSDYKMGDGDRVYNTRFNEKVVSGAVGYSNELLTSVLRISLDETEVGIPEEIGIQETDKSMENPYQKLNTGIVSLNTTLFLGESKLTSIFGFTQNNRKEFEDHHEHEEDHEEDHEEEHDDDHTEEADEAAMYTRLKTMTYDLKWYLPSKGKIESIIGLQGMFQDNTNYGEEVLIPNATTKDIGLYMTHFYQWKNNSLQGGLRADSRKLKTEAYQDEHDGEIHEIAALDKTYEQLTASIGLKTLLAKNVTARLNVASGFRAPTLAELTSDGVHHGSNRFEEGNPDLKSEKNYQLDIALEYPSDHIEFYANGFYNHIDNYIFITPTDEIEDGFPVFEYVQDNSKLYGGEFGFHLHPHPLDWLHFNSSYEMVIGEQDNGEFLPLIPAHQWSNKFRAEFKNGDLKDPFITLGYVHNFAQNKVSMFETPTSAYGLWNLGFGGKFKSGNVQFDLSAHINNLADKKYIAHLSRLKTNGIYNIGRNFMAKLNISI